MKKYSITIISLVIFTTMALAQKPAPIVVNDATPYITNVGVWSLALLDNRADYYYGGFYYWGLEDDRKILMQGEFLLELRRGVFMVTHLVINKTNVIFIDEDNPLPGLPNLDKKVSCTVYCTGYRNRKSTESGEDRLTRWGNFWSEKFSPGQQISIKIRPSSMRVLLSVDNLQDDPQNMEIWIGNQRGCYDSYLSGIFGKPIFSIWVDPIEVPIGSVVRWTIVNRTSQSTVAGGEVTVSRGVGNTSANASGISIENDGGVYEIFVGREGDYIFRNGLTFNSPTPWVEMKKESVAYINLFTEDKSQPLSIETSNAGFRVYGFNGEGLVDITPEEKGARTSFRNEVYQLTGYTAYQVIAIPIVENATSSFSIQVW